MIDHDIKNMTDISKFNIIETPIELINCPFYIRKVFAISILNLLGKFSYGLLVALE